MAYPWSPTDLFCAVGVGCPKDGGAFQNGGPHLKFGQLVVEIAAHDALAHEREAPHPSVDQTWSMRTGPALASAGPVRVYSVSALIRWVRKAPFRSPTKRRLKKGQVGMQTGKQNNLMA
jgi:hypothetical protein